MIMVYYKTVTPSDFSGFQRHGLGVRQERTEYSVESDGGKVEEERQGIKQD
jgi:hypothetical protein